MTEIFNYPDIYMGMDKKQMFKNTRLTIEEDSVLIEVERREATMTDVEGYLQGLKEEADKIEVEEFFEGYKEVEEFFQGLREGEEKIKKEHPERIPIVEAQVAKFIHSRLSDKQKKELQHG